MRIFRRVSLFLPVFLMFCHFSFAGDIKIIGTLPSADTGKTYQLQIGAFDQENNIKKASEILKKNGFVPQYEKVENKIYGCLTRVFVLAVAKDVCSTISSLGSAGFREVIIREYAPKAGTGKSELKTRTESPKDETIVPKDESPKDKPEDKPPQIEIKKNEIPTLDINQEPLRHLFLSLYSQGGK